MTLSLEDLIARWSGLWSNRFKASMFLNHDKESSLTSSKLQLCRLVTVRRMLGKSCKNFKKWSVRFFWSIVAHYHLETQKYSEDAFICNPLIIPLMNVYSKRITWLTDLFDRGCLENLKNRDSIKKRFNT